MTHYYTYVRITNTSYNIAVIILKFTIYSPPNCDNKCKNIAFTVMRIVTFAAVRLFSLSLSGGNDDGDKDSCCCVHFIFYPFFSFSFLRIVSIFFFLFVESNKSNKCIYKSHECNKIQYDEIGKHTEVVNNKLQENPITATTTTTATMMTIQCVVVLSPMKLFAKIQRHRNRFSKVCHNDIINKQTCQTFFSFGIHHLHRNEFLEPK